MDTEFFYTPERALAKNGLLPDKLGLNTIVSLLYSEKHPSDEGDFDQFMRQFNFIYWVCQQIEKGLVEIEGTTQNKLVALPPYDETLEPILLRDTIKKLLIITGMWPLKDCLLANWWPDELGNNQTNKLGKREKQIRKIIAVATQFKYDPLKIPEGGRAKIKTECLKDKLFTDSGFDHAWTEANKQQRISMENKEKYLSN